MTVIDENMDAAMQPEGRHLDAASLFRDHAKYVANFLARLGVREPQVDDLVQEVFLVAHRRGGFVDTGIARPTTWLAAIALRVCSAERRSQRRNRLLPGNDQIDAAPSSNSCPIRATEASESIRNVQRVLEQMDPNSRDVFVLYELENEPCAAIAEVFNIPVGTVYSRLHHARKTFSTLYKLSQRPRSSHYRIPRTKTARATT